MRYIRNKIIVMAVLGMAVAGLAACGSSSSSTSSDAAANSIVPTNTSSGSGSAPKQLTTLKVGIVPASSLASDYLGIQQGYFKNAGLQLKFVTGQSAASLIAETLSGQLDITFAPSVSVIAADAHGADLRMIANQGGLTDPNESSSAIMVAAGSPIKSVKDLVGKKVGVIALHSELDILLHTVVAAAGGDQKAVQSVQIPFPDMLSALQSHRVDAIVTTEPFLTIAKKAGAKVISNPETQLLPNGSTGMWAAKDSYITSHSQLIRGFIKANTESIAYAKTHVPAVRALLPKITSMSPALASQVHLGLIYSPQIESVIKLGDMSKALGYIPNVPPLSQLVWPWPQSAS